MLYTVPYVLSVAALFIGMVAFVFATFDYFETSFAKRMVILAMGITVFVAGAFGVKEFREERPETKQAQLVTEIDQCKVYSFSDGSYKRYFVHCSTGTFALLSK